MNAPLKQVRQIAYSGQLITVSHDGVSKLYSWNGSAWSSRSLEKICDEIRDYEDNPDGWTTCAFCSHPLALEAAVYPNEYDDSHPCHEGECERDMRDA